MMRARLLDFLLSLSLRESVRELGEARAGVGWGRGGGWTCSSLRARFGRVDAGAASVRRVLSRTIEAVTSLMQLDDSWSGVAYRIGDRAPNSNLTRLHLTPA